ncbi:DgyrCDS4927 [Dimorphilus gyrociliatus]|uniref:DgyrCDS4927 n=1 Tax=Dimorphilus gyrociliatus TaxID=2664684 RepID=A0A7I8VJV1_9ANNE|nr:DgyrCDS4927 [Dimorphilus gyrociliatus]
MATPSSISTVSQISGVNNAVEQLQELAIRMKTKGVGFSSEDVDSVDYVIDALNKLDEERELIRQKLETETINASVLRHELKEFPTIIKKEISAAVSAARAANADNIQRLKQELFDMNENIERLENEHRQLDVENAELLPRRDEIREKHNDIIHSLNERMAEKAAKQITLNETRDQLRETNEKILDLEDGITQLKEALIAERAQVRMEKKKLKKAVYDTTLKSREQQELNTGKKKEMDGLYELLTESEEKLSLLKKTIRKFEQSRNVLTEKEKNLSDQLRREHQENEALREEAKRLRIEREEAEKNFSQMKSERSDYIKELKANSEKLASECDILKRERDALIVDLNEKSNIRKRDSKIVKEKQQKLNDSKTEFANLAEDTAKMRQDIVEMEERMIELNESHEAIVATLNKQIEEARQQLGKERKERMEAQAKRDEVQQKIDEVRYEANKSMTLMSKAINEGKKEHDSLAREGTQLQKSIRENDSKIKSLAMELTNLQKLYEDKVQSFNKDIADHEDEEEKLKLKKEHYSVVIGEKTEPFKQLEAEYEERTKAYNELKSEVVSSNNTRMMYLAEYNKHNTEIIDRVVRISLRFDLIK